MFIEEFLHLAPIECRFFYDLFGTPFVNTNTATQKDTSNKMVQKEEGDHILEASAAFLALQTFVHIDVDG